MRIVIFCHSLLSDWNNDMAHFLRGIAMEVLLRGHDVCVYEPRNAWSLQNLLTGHGHGPVARFHGAYPGLASRRYDLRALDLDQALAGVDLVLVHEWCDPELVRRIGQHHAWHGGYRLVFHATHHRCITQPESMEHYDLAGFDAVLAAGSVIREQYLAEGWTRQAYNWHDAADTRVFRPRADIMPDADLVWIGNWEDGERAAELGEFLIGPVRALGLSARVYGNGYTPQAVEMLARAGIEYAGWVPNYQLPEIMARHRVVLHLPPRAHARALPGVPGIRPFEALACARPLICAVWDDIDGLFRPGVDYGLARDGDEMAGWLQMLLHNPDTAEWTARAGHQTVLRRHTCAKRVDQLLSLAVSLPEPQRDLARVSAYSEMPVAM
jgi:spore maturation protein CgeB